MTEQWLRSGACIDCFLACPCSRIGGLLEEYGSFQGEEGKERPRFLFVLIFGARSCGLHVLICFLFFRLFLRG